MSETVRAAAEAIATLAGETGSPSIGISIVPN